MSARRVVEPDAGGLAVAVEACVASAFGGLRRTVRRNLVVLTLAFFGVLAAARSGQGRLSLAALARFLPTPGTAHARAKRLDRFLANPRLDPKAVSAGLARLIGGRQGRGLWPILFDQTKAGATQALVAGVPWEGRALPLAVYTFDYPWQETAVRSQNQLEEIFLADVETALPEGARAVFIGDRGYARAALLRHCGVLERLYILRGRGNTRIEVEGRRCKLRELPLPPPGVAVRYRHVLYQAREKVPLDVVAFHGAGFAEPWWLLVPPDHEALLPTATVVALYRDRMQMEQSFRDFKTHLGLRGLRLKRHIAARTGRLLLAFCLAYGLALILGTEPQAQLARADLENPRRSPRHGTCRTLSVLSLALLMLSHPRWRRRAWERLRQLALSTARGHPLTVHTAARTVILRCAA